MTLYFVRHAESEANEKEILGSRMPFPLSETGRTQAAAVAESFLADHSPDMVVCSPLIRARQTAEAFTEAIAARGFSIPLVEREEITEQQLGRYAGLSYKELETAEGYVHDRGARWDWVPEGGGESYAMIAERLKPFFNWLDSREEDEILVVTHAVTMRLIRACLENSLPEYPLPIAKNGEVWKLDYKGLGARHEIESLIYEDLVPEHRA